MSAKEAKRKLNRLIDLLPTDVLEAIAADVTVPVLRINAFDRRAAARVDRPHVTPRDFAAARQRESAARAMHEVASALLVDALLVQSYGSGEIIHDAAVVLTHVMDSAGVTEMRREPPTPQQRMRSLWDRNRLVIAPSIYARDGYVCRYCGAIEGSGLLWTIDHLTPIERGGTNDLWNLGVACSPCNSRKGAKTEEEFLAWLAGVSA